MTDRFAPQLSQDVCQCARPFVGWPSHSADAMLAEGQSIRREGSTLPACFGRLDPGIFKRQEEINARYLDSLTVDRLLHSFRVTAGISSSVTPYGGWEESDPANSVATLQEGTSFLPSRWPRPARETPCSRARDELFPVL